MFIYNNNQKREYKKYLRQRLFYFLDIVGIDNLDLQQQIEYQKIIQQLGSTKRVIQTEKEKKYTNLPFQFELDKFTLEEYYQLRELGYNVGEIQQMCNVSDTTFYHWRKNKGIVKERKK
ncbi:hypothetical protein G8B32_10700 [Enterococcus faecalis]|uniref:hypothetical protein n=1 Tax=Enterococcus faecalis TaxID=1351 RepID=UPI001884772B|nr:hypothetical protein [Enterococcus faecalis]MBE9855088.1 hypothetical protein [Enterococcus faecalis]